MNDNVHSLLQKLRQRFEPIYGQRLQQMVLFGSQARGDAESGSDVDVMVVLNGKVRPADEIERTGAITAELSLQFDTVLSCLFISTERFESERSPLLLNVRREGVPVVRASKPIRFQVTQC